MTSKLWMGNIDVTCDENYVMSLFPQENLLSVKIIRDKQTGLPVGYGFLEFEDNETALRIMKTYNGKPMDQSGKLFRLNWAQYSNTSTSMKVNVPREIDYSIFVGDIGPNVTDSILYSTFSAKFPSCTTAKVVVDLITGRNKGYGFVKFSNKAEMEQALQMNGMLVCGLPIRVSRAIRKHQMMGWNMMAMYPGEYTPSYSPNYNVEYPVPQVMEEHPDFSVEEDNKRFIAQRKDFSVFHWSLVSNFNFEN
eukprot:TRINITY_DN3270_c0_g1_i1.p1 TRINITY_DN3270_c0_g1~~TRINITY_DN3270_c0_g1_i1.p1  ORF type:complete len:250 (-),score=34.35 TRINITY_DN3270_c0_g1_i1:93-842(-)